MVVVIHQMCHVWKDKTESHRDGPEAGRVQSERYIPNEYAPELAFGSVVSDAPIEQTLHILDNRSGFEVSLQE